MFIGTIVQKTLIKEISMPKAPKKADYFVYILFTGAFANIFEGKMFTTTKHTTLHQIFCYFQK